VILVCVRATLEIEDTVVDTTVEPTVDVAADPPKVMCVVFKAAAGEHDAEKVVAVGMGASGSGMGFEEVGTVTRQMVARPSSCVVGGFEGTVSGTLDELRLCCRICCHCGRHNVWQDSVHKVRGGLVWYREE